MAVVAFAGRGVVRCPLTENLGAVLDALHRLRPGAVRPGGTDLGAALDAAREAFGPEEHAEGRAIVVFSDGEDHLDRWSSRLDRLRQEDIVVHAVAIGDADQGHPVPTGKTAQPLLYHGEPVLSRRADSALETIARRTDGSIVRLGLASGDLGALYRTKIEPAARRRRESTRLAERAERFPLFLIAGLTFLDGGMLAGQARMGLDLDMALALGPGPAPVDAKAGRGRALARARGGLATGAGDAPARTGPESAAEAVARGQAAYGLGRWEEALAAFETAIKRAPASAVPRYNAAATLFQLGRYERPASATSRPASEPARPCEPRSTTPWATRRWPRATSPGRSARTTSALLRRREARPSMRSAATPRSTAGSRSNSRNHFPLPQDNSADDRSRSPKSGPAETS